jgi:hypothetical protein
MSTSTRDVVARDVFTRIVVGVDGTEPGFEACRQVATLAEPTAAIEAVSVAIASMRRSGS